MTSYFPPPSFFSLQPYLSTLVPGLMSLVGTQQYAAARQTAYTYQRQQFGTPVSLYLLQSAIGLTMPTL
ncbi:hypothetical protein [Gloeobacter kilaueensis]|uniref:Uncharacterized protein n=1 Tax=Gloeobacter kilaueensis (strain ATCC BAA-2537 / CCAP 1431/1 / ULC 316 / JS1) TaxID=1183438 RepID=U5QM40_GLOK1|nr:hypothetical protein [Gloeobacter kilaueensis]AGY60052.1 hypothetical protein GKIL_3806 [Gloeobacter kilaueensis JS1]